MMFEVTAGGIYKLPFPFTDLTASKARPALALGDPDENGDVRFAFITTTQPGADEHGLPLTASQFAGPALPYPSYLRLDKTLLLHCSLVLKPLARLSAQAMAQVADLAGPLPKPRTRWKWAWRFWLGNSRPRATGACGSLGMRK